MKTRRILILIMIMTASFAGIWNLQAKATKNKLSHDYMRMLERADLLWEEYRKADDLYFKRGRTNLPDHIMKIAGIHDRLVEVFQQWMQFEMTDELVETDMKVGLMIELQMAAISAEMVGLMEDDQMLMDISDDLDRKYQKVLDDI